MRTLFEDRFAPITSTAGFLKLPFDRAVSALVGWRRGLGTSVTVSEKRDPFPAVLCSLEPLTGGAYPRELLVEAAGGWTAYFDCGLQGTDAVPVISYLSKLVACEGLAIAAIPHTVDSDGRTGRMGSVHFQMFGPVKTGFLNFVRVVAVDYDGQRWVFTTHGTEQPFEEPDAYRSARVRDRFTSDMLERYCLALGLRAFDPAAYGPRAALLVSDVDTPADGLVKSLEEVQEWLRIVPGAAASKSAQAR